MASNQPEFIQWEKWIPLVTQQLRLRNIIQIGCCNLDDDLKRIGNIKEVSYYFTLHLGAMSSPFFTSTHLPFNNPTWPIGNLESKYGVTRELIIRIWRRHNDKDDIVTKWELNFNSLVYVGSPNMSDKSIFQPNTIVFHVWPSGCFTSSEFINLKRIIVPFRTHSEFSSIDIRTSYSVDSLVKLHQLQITVKRFTDKANCLHDKIISYEYLPGNSQDGSPLLRKLLNHSKTRKKCAYLEILNCKAKLEACRFKVQLLKDEKLRRQANIKRLTFARNLFFESNQEEGFELMNHHHTLSKKLNKLKDLRNKVSDAKELLTNLISEYLLRQKQLMSELFFIYPISKLNNGLYAINDVPLPDAENLDSFDFEGLSVALGFTAHFVQLVSCFLDTPLRYPINHNGSKSTITDLTSATMPNDERDFPLFIQNQDRLRFNYGVYLLNKNVAQLRWFVGIDTSDLRRTLRNIESMISTYCDRNMLLDGRTSQLFFKSTPPWQITFPTSRMRSNSPVGGSLGSAMRILASREANDTTLNRIQSEPQLNTTMDDNDEGGKNQTTPKKCK